MLENYEKVRKKTLFFDCDACFRTQKLHENASESDCFGLKNMEICKKCKHLSEENR